MNAMAEFMALQPEIDAWRAAGLRPRLFLRDDDAVDDTPALRRLCDLCAEHGAPLLLAVVPEAATPALAKLLARHPLVTPAAHGYSHRRHSPPGKKSAELGDDRPAETVLAELARGRRKLETLFAGHVSGILVPPWNRIADEVRDRVREAGFEAVSAHGWPRGPSATPMVNAHVDIIHWSGGTVGRDAGWVARELAANLAIARGRGGDAVGILLHHLVHDEQAWAVLEALLAWSATVAGLQWVAADDLVGSGRNS